MNQPITVLLFCLLNITNALNVLLFPALGAGHVNNFESLAQGLASKGHYVYTLFTETRLARLPKSMSQGPNRQVIHYDVQDLESDHLDMNRMTQAMLAKDGDVWDQVAHFNEFALAICERLTLQSENVMEKLAQLKLDVAVVDAHFTMRCAYLVPHRLGLPVVSVVDVIEPWITRIPHLPSHVPLGISPYSDHMTFTQRMQNLVMYIAFYMFPMMPEVPHHILEAYDGVSSTADLVRKSVFWLHTSDPVLDVPKPSMPNMVSIGGLSLKKPAPLTEDYLALLDQPAVLVSFGSHFEYMPKNIALKFAEAFSKLNHTVIWRFNNKNNIDLPTNVHTFSWLPQVALLSHPQVHLFITHCGNGGQHEALYNGVPMVGFPIYGDQPHNAARMVRRGYGLSLDIHDFTSIQLLEAILTVLTNPEFKKRTKAASAIMKSRPQSPQDQAVYYIEHVVQHGDYLHSHATDMPLHEYLMIDILAVIVLCLNLILIAAVLICYWCICKLHKKMKQD